MSDTIRRMDAPRGAPPPAPPAPPAPPPTEAQAKPDLSRATTLYILHLVGFVTSGLTTIIGLILAYVWRGDGDEALDSHCTNAIHVFWKGLLYLVPLYAAFFAFMFGWTFQMAAINTEMMDPAAAGADMQASLSAFFGVMALFVIFSLLQAVWFIVRCAKGIGKASSGLPYPNPRSWGF